MKLNEVVIDYALLHALDEEELLRHDCIAFKEDEFYTHFFAHEVHNSLDDVFQRVCKLYEASKNEIRFFLSHKSVGFTLYSLLQKSLNSDEQNSMRDFMTTLIAFAHEKKSSDIHIESFEKSVGIRLRIDGKLKLFFHFDKVLYSMISSVIKLRCNLDITEKRRPMHGRFSQEIKHQKLDLRVSTLPTIYGESIVLRLLDEQFDFKHLKSLGFSKQHYSQLLQGLTHTHGLILITGPTGSGKTSTLYSILHQLDNEERKIITIEDPIEYQMQHIQQVAVNHEMGLGFSEVLKHILRQDPDVIMIGEIRDNNSLQIALQASLTGHLVLSTLHTNDVFSTLNRLYDLEAKPYIIAAALKMILSQRLVLKQCECISGCKQCNYTSFQGRIALSEILNIDEELALMIHKNKGMKAIKNHAKKSGFISMLEDAKIKIAQRLTTKEEVEKILGSVDETL